MINDLIDDARIQTNTLPFSLHPEDLLTLLKEAVVGQQQAVPEHPIVLDIPSPEQRVPILAGAGRIKHVLTTYLTNALISSPLDPAYYPIARSVTPTSLPVAILRESPLDPIPLTPDAPEDTEWALFKTWKQIRGRRIVPNRVPFCLFP